MLLVRAQTLALQQGSIAGADDSTECRVQICSSGVAVTDTEGGDGSLWAALPRDHTLNFQYALRSGHFTFEGFDDSSPLELRVLGSKLLS